MQFSMDGLTVFSNPIFFGSLKVFPAFLVLNEKSKQQCARCGSCTVVCPVFRVTGREALVARGKLHLLSTDLANDPSSHFQDIFAQCLLCGACEDNCSRQLSIREQIVQARSEFSHFYGQHSLQKAFVRKALSHPALLETLVKAGLSLSQLSLLPPESGLRIKLGLLEKSDKAEGDERESGEVETIPNESKFSYFSGCMARYLQPSIGKATNLLVEDLTGESPFEPEAQMCCGIAAWSAGKIDEARRLAKHNIEVFSQASGQILTSCASCSAHLKKYSTLFEDDPYWQKKAEKFSRRVMEFTSFVDEFLQYGKLRKDDLARVYYHEPCHLRFEKDNSGAALQLLGKIDNISLVNSPEDPQCCGQGGLFHIGYPELSDEIFSHAYDKLCQGKADVVVTSCSGCLMQWQAGLATRKSKVQAVHLSIWLRSCMQINS